MGLHHILYHLFPPHLCACLLGEGLNQHAMESILQGGALQVLAGVAVVVVGAIGNLPDDAELSVKADFDLCS